MQVDTTLGGGKPPNEFEKVDAVQPDALTYEIAAGDEAQLGIIHCPAAATGGRLPKDYRSAPMPGKEAFRSAIKMANDMKTPIVVLDPLNLWPKEWGVLFVVADEEPA